MSSITGGSAKIEWRPSQYSLRNIDIEGYKLLVTASSGVKMTITVHGELQTWCELHSLTPSTKYRLTMAVVAKEGIGEFSDVVEFTTPVGKKYSLISSQIHTSQHHTGYVFNTTAYKYVI